jgi:magnesium-transporting ATPase (P-type)
MEGALVALAMKAGVGPDEHRRDWERIDEIPFDAEHRFMASLHKAPEDAHIIFVKGAPERLLDMCESEARLDGEAPLDKTYWTDRIAEAASHGERVLGFASKPATSPSDLEFSHVESGLVFLGLAGFIDPRSVARPASTSR